MNATQADVMSFMGSRLQKLREGVPGYVSVSIEARHHNSSDRTEIEFRVYSEHHGHLNGKDLDELVSKAIRLNGGKTEADMLRATAAEMLAKAEKLESAEVAP